MRSFRAVCTRDTCICKFVECVVVNARVLSVGLLEDRGDGVGAARVAELFLEALFDSQIGLVDLVQPVGLILGLLPGRDSGCHCNIFCGCLERLILSRELAKILLIKRLRINVTILQLSWDKIDSCDFRLEKICVRWE